MRRRFCLWGARAWSIQIGGSVDRDLAEFRRMGWVPGPLRYRRAGW